MAQVLCKYNVTSEIQDMFELPTSFCPFSLSQALLDDFDYSDDEDDVERRLDERLQAQETGNVDK